MEDEAKVSRWQDQFITAVQEANAQVARRRRDETGAVPVNKANMGG